MEDITDEELLEYLEKRETATSKRKVYSAARQKKVNEKLASDPAYAAEVKQKKAEYAKKRAEKRKFMDEEAKRRGFSK